MRRYFCWLLGHRWAILDWNEERGRMRCTDCQHVEPLRGEALVEWIRWRTKRASR